MITATIQSGVYGKRSKKEGIAPAIGLIDPKYPRNVGTVVRAASCYGIKQVWFSGNRVSLTAEKGKYRLPREERMRGYNDVELRQYDYFIDQFEKGVTPVAIELRNTSEQLPAFEHPENALYIFGPEDGNIPKPFLIKCHRFVVIPTRHCLNLAAAVNVILYDRYVKRLNAGLEKWTPMSELLSEKRVWTCDMEEG